MRLLVTGLTGHSGGWFLKELENYHFDGEIIAVSRNEEKAQQLTDSKLDITPVIGDLSDREFLDRVMTGVDTIVHIASIHHTLDILDIAVHHHVDWFIGVHTTGLYSNFKEASEEYRRIEDALDTYRSQLAITILRPTMIYGSLQDHNMNKLIKFINRSPAFPLFGSGKNLMQPVHAKDLGRAYYQVLTHPDITKNNSYNLAGQYAITYKELIKTVAEKLNKHIYLIHVPIRLSVQLVKAGEKIPGFPIQQEQVLRMQEDKDFTYLRATEDFGYHPMSFEEGIALQVREYIAHKGE